MKIVCIIPARYRSTRFPGKVCEDILGKPMVKWVYDRVLLSHCFEEVYVAIDNEILEEICIKYNMKYIITRENHYNHFYRIQEVSTVIDSDYYFCINGDEPLIEISAIKQAVNYLKSRKNVFALFTKTEIKDATQVVDFSKLKVVCDEDDKLIYISRSPVPYPRGKSDFVYYKYVGIECFTKESLDFYVSTKIGNIEKIEDIDHIRFLEAGKEIYFCDVNSDNLSVDTPKDLERVRKIMQERISGNSND